MSEQKTILIMEDDPDQAYFLGEIIHDLGHEYEITESADEAMKALHKRYYDLIITDILVPGTEAPNGGGLLLITMVRQLSHPKFRKIPIIVITGISNDIILNDLIEQVMFQGANTVLQKPLRVEKLEEVVHDLLSEE